MHVEVGSYEAKTKLPELLRGVQASHRYTITLRDQPIADLRPVQQKKINDAAYLELALRTGLPLATLDADLANASVLAGVVALSTEVG